MNNKPKAISLVLVDGDILCYRAAFATQEKPQEECAEVLERLLVSILDNTVVFPTEDQFKVFLTGQSNFRHKLFDSYKMQRKEQEKPKHIEYAREWLVENYGAVVSEGCEADDLIATEAALLGLPEETVIVSLDKDFKTVNAWLYNFVKDIWHYQTEGEAIKFFYMQVLMGDRTDNFFGIPRVGPAKAAEILKGKTTEEEMYEVVKEAYMKHSLTEEYLLINARMAWLQRYKGQLWKPPI